MMMRIIRRIVTSFAAVLALSNPAGAELTHYTVSVLDGALVPSGNQAIALNSSGEILSYDPSSINGSYRLNFGGAVTGGLIAPVSGWERFKVNRTTLTDNGQTVVEVFRSTGPSSSVSEAAVVDLRSGTVQPLFGTPENGDDDRQPRFSNGGGFVTLQAGPDRGQLQPYRYSTASGWQPLGNLAPGGDGRPLGVNADGTVVGRTGNSSGQSIPFIYTDSAGMQPITDNGSALFGEAVAISSSGLVTGTGNGRAFIFDSNTLEFRFVTEAAGLFASDINSAGAIIGASHLGGNIFGVPVDTAFYWDADTGLTGFEQLLGDQINDWFITDATDINDNGWILGTGFRRADNTYHQVLLRPVPEPGVGLLLGCAALATFRRRRT